MAAILVALACMCCVGALRCAQALLHPMMSVCAAQERCITVDHKATRPDSFTRGWDRLVWSVTNVPAVGLSTAHTHVRLHKSTWDI